MNNWWLLLLLVLCFTPHLYYTYELMITNQTHDLHLRLMGTRLMEAGKNPYTYYWQLGDPVAWYDPNQSIYSAVNGVTTTPFFLWLEKPILQLTYCKIRIVWWCIEEIFLFGTIGLGLLLANSRKQQLLFLLMSSIFFLFSRNWFMHILNGQMYVLYAFAFMLCQYMLLKRGRNVGLWLYPIVCLTRPFFALPILPFFQWNKKTVAALVIGGFITIALFLVAGHQKNWLQYKDALKVYATENTGGYDTVLRNPVARLGYFATEPCLIKEKKPDFLHAGCLYPIQSYLAKMGIMINDTTIFSGALLLFVCLVMFVFYKYKLATTFEQKLVLAMLLYFAGEFFAPAARNPYNMVQWLPMIALLVTYGNKYIVGLLLFGLCLNHSIPFAFKYEKEIGELLILLAAIVFVTSASYSTSKWRNLAQQQN